MATETNYTGFILCSVLEFSLQLWSCTFPLGQNWWAKANLHLKQKNAELNF